MVSRGDPICHASALLAVGCRVGCGWEDLWLVSRPRALAAEPCPRGRGGADLRREDVSKVSEGDTMSASRTIASRSSGCVPAVAWRGVLVMAMICCVTLPAQLIACDNTYESPSTVTFCTDPYYIYPPWECTDWTCSDCPECDTDCYCDCNTYCDCGNSGYLLLCSCWSWGCYIPTGIPSRRQDGSLNLIGAVFGNVRVQRPSAAFSSKCTGQVLGAEKQLTILQRR